MSEILEYRKLPLAAKYNQIKHADIVDLCFQLTGTVPLAIFRWNIVIDAHTGIFPAIGERGLPCALAILLDGALPLRRACVALNKRLLRLCSDQDQRENDR